MLAACLAVGLLPAGVPPSGDWHAAADDSYWTANSSLLVHLADLAATDEGAAEQVGEAFDSPDFQQMLLLPADWSQAYILDLATSEVLAYPQDSLRGADGGFVPPRGAGTPIGTFVTENNGCIEFTTPDHRVTVEPAPPLVGLISREELEMRQPGYARQARSYDPDTAAVRALAAATARVEIIAFFGSWCSTCKEYLPALLSALDAADNPQIQVTLVGMDEDMAQPLELIDEFAIGDVPTFILLRDDVEIGRIEAEPVVSIEADLAEFLRFGP